MDLFFTAALFDLSNGTFAIYRGNPSLAQQPLITIQMNNTTVH
jgi:hypothetical protein